MSGVHLFTSFTYSYLQRARVLARSVRRRHPDWRIWAVMVDETPPEFDDTLWRDEFDEVLDAATLFPGVWPRWIFKHELVEACTAVKGHALLHLLEQGADKVIYLDPDIAVFHSLQGIVDRLDTASVVLTPHQVEANSTENEFVDNEYISMRYGIYNLGFIAVRNDPDGRKAAKWWASRLFHACYDDVSNGIFTDQKYCDLIPSLFSNVYIERDPGYNVASWNLSRRALEISPSGDLLANGSPLKFYHFTKVNSDGDGMTAKYARGSLAVFEVWNWYKRAIAAMELPGIPHRYWYYSRFDDGTPIPKAARLLYRSQPDLMSRFSNPFASGEGSFQNWFRQRGSHPTETIEAIPEEVTPEGLPRTVAPLQSVAVVVHAFYPEILSEICDLLARYTGPMKLFVTTTSDKVGRVRASLGGFVHPFEVIVRPNHGRDILPFLHVLPYVFEERHDYVLKLHTKKSKHREDGDIWRRELLECLADPAELAWTVETLRRRPDVGIVGPEGHVLTMDGYWGSNRSRVIELAERMAVGQVTPDPDVFVAGSMFLARREALEPLLAIGLRDDDFETEAGQTDGTLAHAVERALTYSAAARGLRVACKPASAAGSAADLDYDNGDFDYRFAPRSD
jgi:hypothetical protein